MAQVAQELGFAAGVEQVLGQPQVGLEVGLGLVEPAPVEQRID